MLLGPMDVYLHQNGDFGFNFHKPFRNGGSSRYLTITFLLVPKKFSHLPKRIVRKLYNRRNQLPDVELKGYRLTLSEKRYFAEKSKNLLSRYPEISVFSVTLNKTTIKRPVSRDCGRLYNHINRLVLLDRIKEESSITFIPDQRSIKTENGQNPADDLQTELWFGLNCNTVIKNSPRESRKTLNLQFTDWVGHIIWAKYENNEFEAYDILKRKVDVNVTPWWETLSGQW